MPLTITIVIIIVGIAAAATGITAGLIHLFMRDYNDDENLAAITAT